MARDSIAVGAATIGELGAVTGLDASTLNRQTAALVRDGYADRVADPAGGSARKFRSTPLGDRVVDPERRASQSAVRDIVASWTDADRTTFATLLQQLNTAIETRLSRPWPRPAHAPDGNSVSGPDSRPAERK